MCSIICVMLSCRSHNRVLTAKLPINQICIFVKISSWRPVTPDAKVVLWRSAWCLCKEALTMNRGEWQAVVLCGGMGSRMTELTDRIPKCMLPIAGVAMFWYPLNFLRKNNIKDVLLVVSDRVLPEVKQLLAGKDLPSLGDDMNIEYVSLGSAADEWGTADVLRHIETKIKRDFIVVSGDFVSDMSFAPLMALHRSQNSSLTCLLAENVIRGPVPGPKLKRSKGRDFVALSEKNQLLFLGSEEDFDDTIPVNAHLFSKLISSC